MKIEEIISNKINSAESVDDLALILHFLLSQNAVDEHGEIYSIRALVSSQFGLRIEIYPNEHPPPHFHVRSATIRASFAIDDCTLLEGSVGGRERRVIEWWHKKSKSKLINFWNQMRPTDCPAGRIPIPDKMSDKKNQT